jgi:para-aminobenzoate synthetase/4-amino-4-deoxychorismate lyase
LENTKRGIYTGIIGFITPENDFTFNIAIRTLEIKEKNKASMGIGGGILYDSVIEDEWKEALLKAKFIKNLNKDIVILETIGKKGDFIEYEKEHIERMENSLKVFSTTRKRVRILPKRDISSKPQWPLL